MRSKLRVGSLVATAALAGMAGRSFGQYTLNGASGQTSLDDNSTSNPLVFGSPGTDDTDANNGGNSVTYTQYLFQSYGSPAQAIVPGTFEQGGGSPYVIGTSGYKVQTGSGFQGPSYSTGTTAFYYSPSSGFNYFGQAAPGSTTQYVDTGATTNWSTGTPTGPLISENLHFSSLSGENSAGVAIGYEPINATNSASSGVLGSNAYAFNIPTNTATTMGLGATLSTTVGPTGASYAVNYNYSNTAAGTSQGTYTSSLPYSIDNAGNVSGTTNRYFANGGAYSSTLNSLGTSTWYYNAGTGTTTETGLYGTGYSYQKPFTTPVAGTGTFASNSEKGNIGGYEVGTVTPYVDLGAGSSTSLGTEAWEYTAATNTTTPVSLYQSGLSPNIAGVGTAYNGSTLSYSYNASGQTAMTGRTAFIEGLNSKGQVLGYSNYFLGTSTSKGQDGWVYTPSTNSYQQVGLVSNGFALGSTESFVNTANATTIARNTTPSFINTRGASIGTSTQYLSTQAYGAGTISTNTVAWYTPAGGTSFQIGPNDPYHTATSVSGNYISDSVSYLTDTGLVMGTATRYTPGSTTTNGSDAFVYDTNTNTMSILDPNPNSTSYFSSIISYLSPNGVAVGEYKTSSTGNFSAFVWSAYAGFKDLTSNTTGVTSGSADPNITQLTNAYSYNPTTGTIFTTGQYVSGGAVLTPGGGVAVLTASPVATSAPVVIGTGSPSSGVATGSIGGSGGGSGSINATFSNISNGATIKVDYDPGASVSDLILGDINGIAQSAPPGFTLPTMGDELETWDVTVTGGTFSGPTTLVFQYDPSLLAPGTNQSMLEIWHFSNGAWSVPPGEVVNTANDTITVTVNSFSPFALGGGPVPVPEPASLSMLAIASVGLLRRRRRI